MKSNAKNKEEVLDREPAIMSDAENKAADIKLQAESLVSDFRDLIVYELKGLPAMSFDALKEEEQRDLVSKLEYKIRESFNKVISIVAGSGYAAIPATLDSITVKGGLKLSLKVNDEGDNYETIGEMRGKKIMIVGVSQSDFDKVQREAAIEPDQKNLLNGGGAGGETSKFVPTEDDDQPFKRKKDKGDK